MMKVLGIGDNVVDKYVHIKTMYPGGNAVNFSVFAKKLGVEAAFIGTFGDDSDGEHVEKVLRSSKSIYLIAGTLAGKTALPV